MPSSNIVYNKFVWHFGVVEDRMDPQRLGRCRVRWYGVHTHDKSKVPTNTLPWATPINPVNSAAVSGIGGPYTGLVEGSWVIGFFIDEESYQKPFIMGSIAGIPTEAPNPEAGFNDPYGVYPRNHTNDEGVNNLNESDLSRLAKNYTISESHTSLINRRRNKIIDIPTAVAPIVESVEERRDDAYYQRGAFSEPKPTGNFPSASFYPFNHVYESESGHVFEVDDTPLHERLHDYHVSGTYQEIVSDGTKTTKVVGDNFDIVVRDKNVYIGGKCNVTIVGDSRLLVKGDMYTEVDGNYFLTVKKDKVEKIGGNHVTEILTDRNTQINGNNNIRISGNDISTIDGIETITVGGDHNETITGIKTETVISDAAFTVFGNYSGIVGSDYNQGIAGNTVFASGGVMTIKSVLEQYIYSDTSQNIESPEQGILAGNTQTMSANNGYIDYSTGSIDVFVGNITDTGITLNSHTHAQAADSNGDTQEETASPTADT